MGLFAPLFQKSRKSKHGLGVCIPDARKKSIKDSRPGEDVIGRGFNVTGIFHVHGSLMLQGTPNGGAISKKSKLSAKRAKLLVKDIQVENKSVELLGEGQSGALFLKPEKGKFPSIKIGDLLNF